MIIKRKYVNFGFLYSADEKSKEIIDEAYKSSPISYDEKKRIFEYNYWKCLFECDLGSGLPNPQIIKLGFDELDKDFPFDNNMNYDDVITFDIIEKTDTSIKVMLKGPENTNIQCFTICNDTLLKE